MQHFWVYIMEHLTNHLLFLGIHTNLCIFYYAIENTHNGKVEWNTFEYTAAFMYSDWL